MTPAQQTRANERAEDLKSYGVHLIDFAAHAAHRIYFADLRGENIGQNLSDAARIIREELRKASAIELVGILTGLSTTGLISEEPQKPK